MNSLRILMTNITLAGRSGTETFVRDLAVKLRQRGHQPAVFCTDPGELARELEAAGVPVVGDLRLLPHAPDVIHGHHHPDTMTALLAFPGVPGLFVCHDRTAWHDAPPRFPRLLRYVAVDANCRDRLLEHGIPEALVCTIHNSVDLDRFRPRGPLPARPKRALVFSNYATESLHLHAIQQACDQAGLTLEVVGAGVGKPCKQPETLLGQFDVVLAKARCALEALAVGTAVVLCDLRGVGGMVRAADVPRLRDLNFGARALTEPVLPEVLLGELRRYDAGDATQASRQVRELASLDRGVACWVQLYEEIMDEGKKQPTSEQRTELRAAADYLQVLKPSYKPLRDAVEESERRHEQCLQLNAHARQAASDREVWERELQKLAAAYHELAAAYEQRAAAHEHLHEQYQQVAPAHAALAVQRDVILDQVQQLQRELTCVRSRLPRARLRRLLQRIPLVRRMVA